MSDLFNNFNPSLYNSMQKLLSTHDPRDYTSDQIRSILGSNGYVYPNSPILQDIKPLIRERMRQLDSRDQEYFDLSQQLKKF